MLQKTKLSQTGHLRSGARSDFAWTSLFPPDKWIGQSTIGAIIETLLRDVESQTQFDIDRYRNMKPSVSILIPVHNAASTIESTLQSLFDQTLTDFEIVLVDDGSTDGTIGVAHKKCDPRLRIIDAGRIGLIPALNLGLESCQASLIARMDADDFSAPRRLELQRQYLDTHPEVSVVGCLVESFCDTGTLGEGYLRYDDWLNTLVQHQEIARERFIESPLPHPSVMFRADDVRSIGGYRDLAWPEDYDLFCRMIAAGMHFAKVPAFLLRWRDHPQRTSRTNVRYTQDAILRCKAHHLATGPLRGRRTVVWGAGPIGKRLGRLLQAQGVQIQAWIDIDPRKIGQTIHGAPVLAPESLPTSDDVLLVAAVGVRGARDLVRSHLRDAGWVEGTDYYCAA